MISDHMSNFFFSTSEKKLSPSPPGSPWEGTMNRKKLISALSAHFWPFLMSFEHVSDNFRSNEQLFFFLDFWKKLSPSPPGSPWEGTMEQKKADFGTFCSLLATFKVIWARFRQFPIEWATIFFFDFWKKTDSQPTTLCVRYILLTSNDRFSAPRGPKWAPRCQMTSGIGWEPIGQHIIHICPW